MEYSQSILNFIEKRGVSGYKLAKAIGISEGTLSNWRKKPTSKIDLDIMMKIADYFNVSVDYLLSKTNISTIPEELKGVKVAFYDGAFDGLDEKDIDLLKIMAKRLREEKKK